MAELKKQLIALLMLLRPPYWLMTGGLSVLTIIALERGLPETDLLVLVVVSAICVTSGGFAYDDYIDQESDAIVKKDMPIPSQRLAPWVALAAALILFAIGLIGSLTINLVCFGIAIIDALLLVAYSSFVKRYAGFLGSILMGILIGTSFVYGEAALSGIISITSFSLSFMSMGNVGGNILRDVLSLEGDKKAGYNTLAAKRGPKFAIKMGAVFFLLNALGSPIPYLVDAVGYGYLIPITIWNIILVVSGVTLLRNQDIEVLKKHERIVTRTMILIPLALIAGALT